MSPIHHHGENGHKIYCIFMSFISFPSSRSFALQNVTTAEKISSPSPLPSMKPGLNERFGFFFYSDGFILKWLLFNKPTNDFKFKNMLMGYQKTSGDFRVTLVTWSDPGINDCCWSRLPDNLGFGWKWVIVVLKMFTMTFKGMQFHAKNA